MLQIRFSSTILPKELSTLGKRVEENLNYCITKTVQLLLYYWTTVLLKPVLLKFGSTDVSFKIIIQLLFVKQQVLILNRCSDMYMAI